MKSFMEFFKLIKSQSHSNQIRTKQPICVFGVLADSQYADIDDCTVYGRTRYYKTSLDRVRNAINYWNSLINSNNNDQNYRDKFKFVLQLGDIIEGFRSDKLLRTNHLNEVLSELDKLNVPIYHCWGNHELYAFSVDYLVESPLNTAKMLNQDSNLNYYYVDITNRIRLIALNLYELSFFERDKMKLDYIKDEVMRQQKLAINKGYDERYLLRYKAYNGAVTSTQLKWLKKQLDFCQLSNKKVILCGHTPLEVDAGEWSAVSWSSVEILNLIWSYENLVLLYLAGHQHTGGYHYDSSHNIHHLTMNAILETNPNDSKNAFATVCVYEDEIVLENQKTDKLLKIPI